MTDKLHPIIEKAGREFADGKLGREEFIAGLSGDSSTPKGETAPANLPPGQEPKTPYYYFVPITGPAPH